MVIDFSGETVQPITHSVLLGGGDVISGGNVVSEEEVPVMKHANARNGSCLMEVNDGSTYTKTLVELLALHSEIGKGEYTVTIDGVIYAYHALLTVSMIGQTGQYVSISWRGSQYQTV